MQICVTIWIMRKYQIRLFIYIVEFVRYLKILVFVNLTVFKAQFVIVNKIYEVFLYWYLRKVFKWFWNFKKFVSIIVSVLLKFLLPIVIISVI